jgi:hypothetical protein
MKTRHGKIARLPKELREQFHGRASSERTNNVKIKPWAITSSKWITVYQGISNYIKVDKGGRGLRCLLIAQGDL